MTSNSTKEVIRILRSSEAKKVFRENNVLAAYLFGSLAKGVSHAQSDVDVAIIFERSVPPSEYFKHEAAITLGLMRLLHTDKLDVVALNEAPLLLAFQALKYKKLLYSADEFRRAEFEVRIIGMYYDFKPVLDSYGRQMFRRIKERGLR